MEGNVNEIWCYHRNLILTGLYVRNWSVPVFNINNINFLTANSSFTSISFSCSSVGFLKVLFGTLLLLL